MLCPAFRFMKSITMRLWKKFKVWQMGNNVMSVFCKLYYLVCTLCRRLVIALVLLLQRERNFSDTRLSGRQCRHFCRHQDRRDAGRRLRGPGRPQPHPDADASGGGVLPKFRTSKVMRLHHENRQACLHRHGAGCSGGPLPPDHITEAGGISLPGIAIGILCFVLLQKFKLSVPKVIGIAAVLGLVCFGVF